MCIILYSTCKTFTLNVILNQPTSCWMGITYRYMYLPYSSSFLFVRNYTVLSKWVLDQNLWILGHIRIFFKSYHQIRYDIIFFLTQLSLWKWLSRQLSKGRMVSLNEEESYFIKVYCDESNKSYKHLRLYCNKSFQVCKLS